MLGRWDLRDDRRVRKQRSAGRRTVTPGSPPRCLVACQTRTLPGHRGEIFRPAQRAGCTSWPQSYAWRQAFQDRRERPRKNAASTLTRGTGRAGAVACLTLDCRRGCETRKPKIRPGIARLIGLGCGPMPVQCRIATEGRSSVRTCAAEPTEALRSSRRIDGPSVFARTITPNSTDWERFRLKRNTKSICASLPAHFRDCLRTGLSSPLLRESCLAVKMNDIKPWGPARLRH